MASSWQHKMDHLIHFLYLTLQYYFINSKLEDILLNDEILDWEELPASNFFNPQYNLTMLSIHNMLFRGGCITNRDGNHDGGLVGQDGRSPLIANALTG